MAVNSANGIRVNHFLIFSSGLVLIAASAIIYFFILRSIYGNIQLSEITPSRQNIIDARFQNKKIGLLHSKYTENMLAARSDAYNDNVDLWKRFLSNRNYDYDIISDQTIESGKISDYSGLILPGASALSELEIYQLKQYMENGGGVFGIGGIGLYSEDGKWKDWSLYSEVFGLEFSYEDKPDSGNPVFTILGGLPVTHGIPAGYSFELASWVAPIACRAAEPRTISAGYLYNYRSNKGLILDEIDKSSGMTYGHYGEGRYIWLGFEIDAITGDKDVHVHFEQLLNNSLTWLLELPTAFIANWPSDYNSAAIILPIAGSDKNISARFLSLLDSLSIPANMLVESGGKWSFSVPQNKELDYGILSNLSFQNNDDSYAYLWKRDNLLYAKTKLEESVKEKPVFAVFSKGMPTQNALKAADYTGINCIMFDSLNNCSEPFIVRYEKNEIVVTPITNRDDRFLIRQEKLKSSSHLAYTFMEDVQRINAEKGLYALKLRSDLLSNGELYAAVASALRYTRSENIWFPTIEELKEWRFQKERLNIAVDERSKKRVAVKITNTNDVKVYNAALIVNINKEAANISIQSDIFGSPDPVFVYNPNTQTVTITIKEIEAGESFSYLIDFENPVIAALEGQ